MNKIIFIVGPSGCGKTHLRNKLIENYPNKYYGITTTVTRAPRPDETNGVDYHFVTLSEFQDLRYEENIVQEVSFGGNCYGTTFDEYLMIDQPTGLFVCTPDGINDTINALNKHDLEMDFEIVFFLTTEELLRKHGVDQKRIDRGDILNDFISRYSRNEFGPEVLWIDDIDVNSVLHHNVNTFYNRKRVIAEKLSE